MKWWSLGMWGIYFFTYIMTCRLRYTCKSNEMLCAKHHRRVGWPWNRLTGNGLIEIVEILYIKLKYRKVSWYQWVSGSTKGSHFPLDRLLMRCCKGWVRARHNVSLLSRGMASMATQVITVVWQEYPLRLIWFLWSVLSALCSMSVMALCDRTLFHFPI